MDDAELELAREVHYGFLPDAYEDEHLAVAVTALPHRGLGGDYCGIVPLADGRVALTVSDATGHGFASALFAARINTYVLSRVTRSPQPCHLIEALNAFLTRSFPSRGFLSGRAGRARMHATFCAAIIDPRARVWHFAGAGHPPAILYRTATRDTVLVKSQTTMVGIFETLPEPCVSTTSRVEAGDRILLFTDGLTDARNGEAMPFGLERLQAAVIEHADKPGAAFNEALIADAKTWGGGALSDDVLLLTATCRNAAGC